MRESFFDRQAPTHWLTHLPAHRPTHSPFPLAPSEVFATLLLMRPSSRTRYVLGIDFGTLSGRAMLIEVTTGREAATAVHEYAHGVMDETLPGGTTRLAPNTALQDPADYLAVLRVTIPKVLRTAKVAASQVIGSRKSSRPSIGEHSSTCRL